MTDERVEQLRTAIKDIFYRGIASQGTPEQFQNEFINLILTREAALQAEVERLLKVVEAAKDYRSTISKKDVRVYGHHEEMRAYDLLCEALDDVTGMVE